MTNEEFLKNCFYFIHLSKNKKTGTRKELSALFNISESSVKRMIRCLRNVGYDIEFCLYNNSYIVNNEFKLIGGV